MDASDQVYFAPEDEIPEEDKRRLLEAELAEVSKLKTTYERLVRLQEMEERRT